MRHILLTGGGISVVALAGVLAQYDPNYIAFLWPLIGVAAGSIYAARHPEVLPPQVRALLPGPQRALPDLGQPPLVTPMFTPPEPIVPSVDFAALRHTQQPELLGALLGATMLPPPSESVATAPPRCDIEIPALSYAPGMAERWLHQFFATISPSHLVPVANRSIVSLANSVLALLVIDGVSIRRAQLGSAESAADTVWSVLLLIADRAPSETACTRLRARLASVHVQPYTSGGTAILLVLAGPLLSPVVAPVAVPIIPPAPVTTELVEIPASQITITLPAETDVSADTEPDVAAIPQAEGERNEQVHDEPVLPALPSSDDELVLPTSPPSIDRSDEALPVLSTLAVKPREVSVTDLRALERAVADATPRPPLLAGRASLVTPSSEELAAFARLPPVWNSGDALPHVHLGVAEDGRVITSPLEHINIIAATRGGKTSVKLHMMRQLLRARHPRTGEGILNLFVSTKYIPINQYEVDIRPIITRCYNMRTLETPQGVEEDGSGAHRVLLLTGAELNRRLRLMREQPGSRFTPFVLFADEWRVIRSRTEKLVLPLTSEGKRPNAWDQCLDVVDMLLPQGLEPLMPLILGSQDAQSQNTGVNTGTWVNFGSYLLHTDTDSTTIQNITKTDRAKMQRVAAIQERHTGWIYLRGREIIPIWMPWVTNELISSWVADLDTPVGIAPATRAELPNDARDNDDDDNMMVTPAPLATTGAPRPEDWPASVQSLIAALGSRLTPLLKAFAALGRTVPLRVSGAERRAIFGIPAPTDPPNLAPYDANLVRLLKQLRRAGISSNTLAAVLFGRTGQAAQDVTDAIALDGR